MHRNSPQFVSRPRRAGSSLLAVLVAGIFLVVLVGGYIQSSLHQLAESDRATARVVLSALIEAGVEEALWMLQTGDHSDWTEKDGDFSRRIDDWSGMGNNSQSEISIDLALDPDQAVVRVSARLTTGRAVALSRTAEVVLERQSIFGFGLEVHDSLTLSGNPVSLDSYDSRRGPHDASTNRGDRIVVASASPERHSANIGNGSIRGILLAGHPEAIRMGPQGSVARADPDIPAIFGDLALDRPFRQEPPAVSGGFIWPGGDSVIVGDPTGFRVEEYALDSLEVKSKETIHVQGPVRLVVAGNVRWQGTLVLGEAGELELHFGGSFDSTGGALLNDSRRPDRFRLFAFGEERQRILIGGNAAFAGVIFAPEGDLATVGGGVHGRFYGAAVLGSMGIRGRYRFHFDEALRDRNDIGSIYRVSRWREHAGVALR